MYETHSDLPQKTRERMIELLNARLADVIDLRTRIKVAHWNVKGWSFIGLHKLFDEIAEAVDKYSDLIGERASQLGGIAEGIAREASARSALEEFAYPSQDEQEEYVAAVAADLASFGRLAHGAIQSSQDAGDYVTSDIFIDVERGIDEWRWFVEAHEQARAQARPAPTAGIAEEEQPTQH